MAQWTPLYFGLFLISSLALASPPSPDSIVKSADEARAPEGSYSFTVNVSDSDEGSTLKETTYRVRSKDAQFVLIETVAPERLKGRKLLMRENDLWLYLPNVKRPTRVSFQQRLTGEVANGDLARTNFARDYDAKSLGTEKIEGKDCHKLSLSAKTKDVTYRSITYWVEKQSLRPVRADFFAISGKKLKQSDYSNFQTVLGKTRMTEAVITDALRPKKQSRLRYSNYLREKFNDSEFNKESLAE